MQLVAFSDGRRLASQLQLHGARVYLTRSHSLHHLLAVINEFGEHLKVGLRTRQQLTSDVLRHGRRRLILEHVHERLTNSPIVSL